MTKIISLGKYYQAVCITLKQVVDQNYEEILVIHKSHNLVLTPLKIIEVQH